MAESILNLSGRSRKFPEKLKAFEPTHSSRYWMMVRLLDAIGGVETVLDVGGKKGLLNDFTGYKSTIIDIDESDEPNFIQGSALAMPFNDKAFDAAISCDVLEHIQEKDRQQFIHEMIRVSSQYVIICAPFKNPGVADAEVAANNYYQGISGEGHQWLIEHIENGLPTEGSIEKYLHNEGAEYTKFRHFDLEVWLNMVKVHMVHASFGDSKELTKLANQLYADYFEGYGDYDFSEHGYRTFYVIRKAGSVSVKLPSAEHRQDERSKFLQHINDSTLLAAQQLVLEWREQEHRIDATKFELRQLEERLQDAQAAAQPIGQQLKYKVNKATARIKHKLIKEKVPEKQNDKDS